MKILSNGKHEHQGEVRSMEVQEILSAPPASLIRWGISAIFLVLLMMSITSYFVRYPETIQARLTITSNTPPTSIVARSVGRLDLFVNDGQAVKEGAHLGLIENSANSKDILQLITFIDKFNSNLSNDFNRTLINIPENLNAGELQITYLSFLKNLKEYDLFHQLGHYEQQINVLEDQIRYNTELDQQLKRQVQLSEQELSIAKKQHAMDSSLFSQKVIAEADFDKSTGTFIAVRKSHQLVLQTITNNKIRRTELESSIGELKLQREEKLSTFNNEIAASLKQLESQLRDWEQKYLLRSPIDGNVSFFKHRTNNQFINQGEEIMRIMPDSSNIFAEVLMPVAGSGKVEIGQRVNIRLDNYPSHEYGLLIGSVERISGLPKENMYSIQVRLPKGLTTTYKKKLPPRQEMQGSAEIITKDLRLTDRILNQFRTLVDKAELSEHTLPE
jgi:HlyD family secretion protein